MVVLLFMCYIIITLYKYLSQSLIYKYNAPFAFLYYTGIYVLKCMM